MLHERIVPLHNSIDFLILLNLESMYYLYSIFGERNITKAVTDIDYVRKCIYLFVSSTR